MTLSAYRHAIYNRSNNIVQLRQNIIMQVYIVVDTCCILNAIQFIGI